MDPLAKKKQENIAGYVISMWHLEDLLRAERFDLKAIEAHMVEPMDADEKTKASMLAWYALMTRRMVDQGIQERGHLSEVREVMHELEYLHRTLIDLLNDEVYEALFAKAEPGITTIQEAAGEDAVEPISTCLTAIYGVMMLRAKGEKISEGTAEAEGHMRRLLEHLSKHYLQMRKLPGVSLN